MTSFVQPAKFRPPADSPTRPAPAPRRGVDLAIARAARGAEISLTVKSLPGEGVAGMFGRLAETLKELDATTLHLQVFGSVGARAAGMEAMRESFGAIDWPVTWVEGAACDGGPIAGLQALAFAGGEVQRLRADGRVVGSVFEDGAFRHCLLGGLGPNEITAPRTEQTKQTLDQLAAALAQGGFAFADVARTWFFLDNMLAWYDEFNRVRTQIYSGIKFRTGALPASTGIGGRNPALSALVAGAWAARPLNAGARVAEIASPLQGPASAYGSAFSRAIEMSSPQGRRLLISGTASIAPDGRTLWQDDARGQVAQTMRVVEAILRSRDFSWPDLTRATGYFKHQPDARLFGEWCAAHDQPNLPVVLTNCDVCRDDLLFEIELDAWRSNQLGNPAGQRP